MKTTLLVFLLSLQSATLFGMHVEINYKSATTTICEIVTLSQYVPVVTIENSKTYLRLLLSSHDDAQAIVQAFVNCPEIDNYHLATVSPVFCLNWNQPATLKDTLKQARFTYALTLRAMKK